MYNQTIIIHNFTKKIKKIPFLVSTFLLPDRPYIYMNAGLRLRCVRWNFVELGLEFKVIKEK
jgi:hypothetical protein